MPVPDWWPELMAVSDLLAAEDRSIVDKWRGGSSADADDPPLTVRLGDLADAFARHATELTPAQRRDFLGILERVVATGSPSDRDAVGTGFLEALLNAYDKGFDLRSAWADLGPVSRAYCRAWNEFTGVPSPDWMRESGTG